MLRGTTRPGAWQLAVECDNDLALYGVSITSLLDEMVLLLLPGI